MKKRQMTPLMGRLCDIARAADLTDPVGRAAAMINRRYNDGLHRLSTEQIVAHMRSFLPTTAVRWRMHWLAGGSLKTLDRTAAQESARRKVYEKQCREHDKEMRKKWRTE